MEVIVWNLRCARNLGGVIAVVLLLFRKHPDVMVIESAQDLRERIDYRWLEMHLGCVGGTQLWVRLWRDGAVPRQ